MRDDGSLRVSAFAARAPLHERDDRREHGRRRIQVPFVHSQLAAAEAHHDVAVAREAQPADAREPKRLQAHQQFLRRLRGRCSKAELQLARIARATEQLRQRAKHFVGPGSNARRVDDHTKVETSTLSPDRRILFTDDGRPPRMRLETVPAVEMTVPFLVCSM